MKTTLFVFYLLIVSSKLFAQDSTQVTERSPLRPEVHITFGSNNQTKGSYAPPYALGVRACIDTPF